MKYKDPRILDAIYFLLYRFNNRFLRKAVRKLILMRRGAGLHSRSLRKLLLKYHGIEIGLYSMYKSDHYAKLPWGTTVGRYSSLAKGLVVINGSHPIRHKSTHALFFNPDLGYIDRLGIARRKSLTIGHDVYMGTNVMILPNVNLIGTGAVISAGSVVIKDVPPYAIVGGNPAKLIKYRFSEETIKKLMESKWWEKDIDQILADESDFKTFLRPLEE